MVASACVAYAWWNIIMVYVSAVKAILVYCMFSISFCMRELFYSGHINFGQPLYRLSRSMVVEGLFAWP